MHVYPSFIAYITIAGRHGGFTAGDPWLPAGPEIERRNVETQEKGSGSLLNFYRRAIHLRRTLPALQEGSYASITKGAAAGCYLFMRRLNDATLIVALNFSNRRRKCKLDPVTGSFRVLLSTGLDRQAETLTGKSNDGNASIIHVTEEFFIRYFKVMSTLLLACL